MSLSSLFRRCCLLLLAAPLLAAAQGALENPQPDATESGIGVISGWHCTGSSITVSIDGVSLGKAGSGTLRPDTSGVCGGKTQTGFSLLTNFSRLAPGAHRIEIFVDGVLFASRDFRSVKSGGVEFLQGMVAQALMPDFPTPGQTSVLEWSQARQSFVITSFMKDGDEQALSCSMLERIMGNWSMRYTIASEFSTTFQLTGPPTPNEAVLAPCVMSGTDSAGTPSVGVAYAPYSGQYVIVQRRQAYNEVYGLRATTSTRLDGYYYQQFPTTDGPTYTAYAVKLANSGGAPQVAGVHMSPLDLDLLKLAESNAVSALRTQPDAQRQPDATVRAVAAIIIERLNRMPSRTR